MPVVKTKCPYCPAQLKPRFKENHIKTTHPNEVKLGQAQDS